MVTRRAECACGQLSATCEGEPFRVSVCHCLACKRRTGSAFSFNARWQEEQVRVRGLAAQFTRIGDEGGHVTYNFCPECGTTVSYRIEEWPGVVAIPAGAFADLDFPPPAFSVYDESRRFRWLAITADPLQIDG